MLRKAPNSLNLVGQTFYYLTVTSKAETHVTPGGSKKGQWNCLCKCGNTTVVGTSSLKSGNTKSCGCYRKEIQGTQTKTHGLSKTKEHELWSAMIGRCYTPSSSSYKDYGGRGIKVCDKWLGENGFINFLADMGTRPSPQHTLERVDVNRNYEPSNVIWLLGKYQAHNTRQTKLNPDLVRYIRSEKAKGRSYADLGRELNVSASTASLAGRRINWKDVV